METGLENWNKTFLGRRESGKMTDSQDNFLFYYREIDPRKENFTLSATIGVEDTSGIDFQTAYGLAAVDTIASATIKCRHRNFALLGRFRTPDGDNYGCGLRIVSGYTNRAALPQDRRRKLDPSRLFKGRSGGDGLKAGTKQRFRLVKTDQGFEASLETAAGWETISFPGCDFLLKQDRHSIYVGFAIAGNIKLNFSDVHFETMPGRISHTPRSAVRRYYPDYPFKRTLLPEPPAFDGDRLCNTTLKVSPDQDGTSLASALREAGPGCRILLSDGIYPGPFYIPESVSGKPKHPILLQAEHPGKAVINGSGMRDRLPAMTLRGRHWILDGLVFRDARSSGLFICGSDNLVKNCEAIGNADTGILICSFPGSPRRKWPARNRVESCISSDNCDNVRRNADGFGAKITLGKGNGFYSCKAVHNIDDGFDLYTKSSLGPIGRVTLVDCEAAYNGWLSSEEGPGESPKTGIGFKLGGEGQYVRHRLSGCIAHDNVRSGFDPNSNPGSILRECKAWNNGTDFAPFPRGFLSRLRGKLK